MNIVVIRQSASLVAQMIKNLPAMQETRVRFLSQKNPLEKGMATHFSILAWKIPWREKPGGLQSMGSQRVGHDCVASTFNGRKELVIIIICQFTEDKLSTDLKLYLKIYKRYRCAYLHVRQYFKFNLNIF